MGPPLCLCESRLDVTRTPVKESTEQDPASAGIPARLFLVNAKQAGCLRSQDAIT